MSPIGWLIALGIAVVLYAVLQSRVSGEDRELAPEPEPEHDQAEDIHGRLIFAGEVLALNPTAADIATMLDRWMASPVSEEEFFILEQVNGYVQGHRVEGERIQCEYHLDEDDHVYAAASPLSRDAVQQLLTARLNGNPEWRGNLDWQPVELEEAEVQVLGDFAPQEARKLLDVLTSAGLDVEMVQQGATLFRILVHAEDLEAAQGHMQSVLKIG